MFYLRHIRKNNNNKLLCYPSYDYSQNISSLAHKTRYLGHTDAARKFSLTVKRYETFVGRSLLRNTYERRQQRTTRKSNEASRTYLKHKTKYGDEPRSLRDQWRTVFSEDRKVFFFRKAINFYRTIRLSGISEIFPRRRGTSKVWDPENKSVSAGDEIIFAIQLIVLFERGQYSQ